MRLGAPKKDIGISYRHKLLAKGDPTFLGFSIRGIYDGISLS